MWPSVRSALEPLRVDHFLLVADASRLYLAERYEQPKTSSFLGFCQKVEHLRPYLVLAGYGQTQSSILVSGT